MDTEDVIENLNSTKSANRRRAAKQIGKSKLSKFGTSLYQAYLKERNDHRTWETQTEMIKALGSIRYTKAIDDIITIVRQNIPHDMITYAAATTYVQLRKKSVRDAEPVLKLLQFGSISVVDGALRAVAVERLSPTKNQIEELIKMSWDINLHEDMVPGLTDPRQFLAIACANWNNELATSFLHHCINTAQKESGVLDEQLIRICQNSLKGKFSSYYL